MRIFMACADERLRIALLLLLDDEPSLAVVGITDRLENLIRQLQASQPDVLVLAWEIALPAMRDLITRIRNLDYPPGIVFLSNRSEEQETILAAGADHFIPMNVPPDNLISTLGNLQLPKTKNPTTQL